MTTTTYCTACGVTYGRGHDEDDCVCGAPYRLAVTVTADWEAQALSIGSEYLPTAARKVRDRAPLTAAERQAYVGWIADQLATAGE